MGRGGVLLRCAGLEAFACCTCCASGWGALGVFGSGGAVCGCFGGGGASDNGIAQYPWEIARDVGLLACGVWAGLFPRSPLALDNWLFALDASAPADDEELEESRA